MGYSRPNEDRLHALGPTLQKIHELQDGAHLVIEGASPEQLARMRLDIYSWMFLRGIKALYKIRQLGPTELMVTKLGTGAPLSTREIQPGGLDRVRDFVVDSLLDLTEPEARLKVEGTIKSGLLTLREGEQALIEWRRLTQ